MVDITIVYGVYKPTNISGRHYPVMMPVAAQVSPMEPKRGGAPTQRRGEHEGSIHGGTPIAGWYMKENPSING